MLRKAGKKYGQVYLLFTTCLMPLSVLSTEAAELQSIAVATMTFWARKEPLLAYVVLVRLVFLLSTDLSGRLGLWSIDDFSEYIDCKGFYYREMNNLGLTRSMKHQEKFMARRSEIRSLFPMDTLYQPITSRYAAVVVSDSFAFLHIWKCGGTTVVDLTPEEHDQLELNDKQIQERKWFALVRDPIDRYISAWAECGMRLYNGEDTYDGYEKQSALNFLDDDYDFRLRAWLDEVKQFTPPAQFCHTHAFPQANFMLNSEGKIDDHLAFVGDLSELMGNLQLAGTELKPDAVGVGRDSSQDTVKMSYFAKQRELLSEETLLALCSFYAIDYFLFDFDPPEVCVYDGGPLDIVSSGGRRLG